MRHIALMCTRYVPALFDTSISADDPRAVNFGTSAGLDPTVFVVAAIDQAAMGPVLNLSDLPFTNSSLFLRGSASRMADFSLQAIDCDPHGAVTVRRLHDVGK